MGESGAQYDDDWEDDTATDYLDGLTARNTYAPKQPQPATDNVYGAQDDEPIVMSSRVDGPRDMFGEEIVALVRNTVETMRRAERKSLASSNVTEDVAAQAKLTVYLKSQGFREFPEKAIELLKPDVERLVIAHNAIPLIPYRFSELQGLTFLNMRSNRLREFPKAFLKLAKLQFLEISSNQLSKIPEEIVQMKSLRVLAASSNNLEGVPFSLGHLDELRILKIEGNPLNDYFQKLVQEAGGFPIQNSMQPQLQTGQELDRTLRLKEILRRETSSAESNGDSSESPLETPRPLRRNNSLRFPVAIPGLSGSESTPDLTSPSSLRSKSHQRVISGTGSSYSGSRRPGIAPLLITSDRNRSQSEGMPQAAQSLRTKRISLLSKKQQELTVDPNKLNRNSNSLHLRGVSHGSALKERSASGRLVGRSNLSNGSSISELDHGHADMVVRRLSSLPEAEVPDLPTELQGCKGLLYSLHQMHVVIGNQYNIVRQGTPKRSSLERVYYNATSHLENLDGALYNTYNVAEEDETVLDNTYRSAREGTKSCAMAYKQVIELIYRGADHYVSQTDPRYVRTFLHLLYASITEAVNATANLRKALDESHAQTAVKGIPSSSSKGDPPKLTVRGTTPIKEKPRNNITTRLRTDTLGSLRSHSSRYKSSSNPYSSVPLYVSGRSRSNSRNLGSGQSATFSPMTSTPHSGNSSFMPHLSQSPGLPTPAQDYNPIHTADFNNQDLHFEQVHLAYAKAVNACNNILPDVYQRFRNLQKVLIENSAPKQRLEAQSRLVFRAKYCQDQANALQGRLSAVKLKDPEIRRSPDFWRHCTKFLNSFIKMVGDVKAISAQYGFDQNIVRILKPVHMAVKVAVHATKNSPWSYFLDAPSPSLGSSRISSAAGSPSHSRAPSKDTPPSSYGGHSAHPSSTMMPVDRLRAANAGSSVNLNARTRGDSETSLSPYLPQTPLSAALGPAAQATVPSTLVANIQPGTPPKSSLDTSFRGDVFERADTLLRSQSVIGHRR